MADPVIDILVPAYNAEPTIREAIDSLRNQTVRNIRIVVVDDGSTDATGRILAEMAAQDGRIVVLTQPNGGIVAALTYGLSVCRAPFIARHDADDLAAPDRLERQIRHMEEHPDCVAVSGSGSHIDAQGRPTGGRVRLARIDKADPFWIPAREPYLPQPFLLMRRAAFDLAGGYRSLAVAEDSDLYWRLDDIGTLSNIDRNFGSYRVHAGSVSSASIRNGRSMAFWSQMAALSARRRRAGQPDQVFSPAELRRCEAAETLEEFFRAGCPGLTQAERSWLALALGMKLVALAFYRPYELDSADCAFIGRALRDRDVAIGRENRVEIAEHLMATATRLAAHGRFGDALKLVSPARYPVLLGRISFRLVLPSGLRDVFKRLAGRAQPA
ncbi:glycosyltransferase family 2 protein [Gluconacetobacter diazotrophicus]|uniref:Putative glycosyl transferase n=2 Tax=Gluconacetobacter diazotrophicus (strain ATCC 49037 / DSM 5601 / CCUG 37298 / CIP 103539 / LMG 7603 / PAl5) TaxID=272568 RepID=A9HNP4_GLUDA|nr:glycosyltransferase family 2 protein [Gluconacetobacter diazotrophicus]CAP56479.1 putative glycosyl transferase [Gluconacetobacter diazotrophicus PA1 5]